MTQKQVAALAIRILAIYSIINSFGWLQQNVSFLFYSFSIRNTPGTSIPLWHYALSFAPFIVRAACGVVLWILADALAFIMTPHDDRKTIAIRLAPVEILTISFGVTGLWFALLPMARVAQSVSEIFLYSSSGSVSSAKLPVELILNFIQIAIGLYLFLRARNLADKIAARYALSTPPPIKDS